MAVVNGSSLQNAFGLRIAPSVDREGAHSAKLNFDPYAEGSIERIIDAWAPFVVAMNIFAPGAAIITRS